MPRVHYLDIEFDNSQAVFFAGQDLIGKIVLELDEPKKINEILLEIKGCAKTYWTKHSGKSKQHFADSEPYFCEQFNTHYTKQFEKKGQEKGKDKKLKERILPIGKHEIPFRYHLSRELPSSFEGDWGFVRYTVRATLERPWDFDIGCKRGFTVVGLEDINKDDKSLKPIELRDSKFTMHYCCRASGHITVGLQLQRTGYAPGENIFINAQVNNESTKQLKYSIARVKQNTKYMAKSFFGDERTKEVTKLVAKMEKGPIAPNTLFSWMAEPLRIPPVAPKLVKCKIIEVDPGVTVMQEITIGTIPLVEPCHEPVLKKSAIKIVEHNNMQPSTSVASSAEVTPTAAIPLKPLGNLQSPPKRIELENPSTKSLAGDSAIINDVTQSHSIGNIANAAMNSGKAPSLDEGSIQLTVTEPDGKDTVLGELNSKNTRTPASILMELYPNCPIPTFETSIFGLADIVEEKENVLYGETKFTPKYACYQL